MKRTAKLFVSSLAALSVSFVVSGEDAQDMLAFDGPFDGLGAMVRNASDDNATTQMSFDTSMLESNEQCTQDIAEQYASLIEMQELLEYSVSTSLQAAEQAIERGRSLAKLAKINREAQFAYNKMKQQYERDRQQLSLVNAMAQTRKAQSNVDLAAFDAKVQALLAKLRTDLDAAVAEAQAPKAANEPVPAN